ncbi:hypothetical protein QVD17_13936 [Tagetes erecta]|uniref:Uncharacterized protein n=1 Tax=Tagetes erecta TaxID=13708 RepID=A0AAD8KWI8_TARER|nr:hypothetical protein QVD17_13936 [Tagetes erecta]
MNEYRSDHRSRKGSYPPSHRSPSNSNSSSCFGDLMSVSFVHVHLILDFGGRVSNCNHQFNDMRRENQRLS